MAPCQEVWILRLRARIDGHSALLVFSTAGPVPSERVEHLPTGDGILSIQTVSLTPWAVRLYACCAGDRRCVRCWEVLVPRCPLADQSSPCPLADGLDPSHGAACHSATKAQRTEAPHQRRLADAAVDQGEAGLGAGLGSRAVGRSRCGAS